MGASGSSLPEQTEREVEDERFGGMVGLLESRGRVYVTKSVTVDSNQEMNRMVGLSTERAKLKHRNFCTVRNYELDKRSDFCSNGYVIRLYFDYYPNDLEKEIAQRAEHKKHFSEEWIGSTLFGLVQCLRYLEERGCYQGDIKAGNVLLDVEGAPRLLDSYFTHFGRSNFELVLSSPTTLSYLSPEQLSSLRKGHYSKPQENRVKNQVFSLGMTMMEAMLLENSFECYEMNLLKLLENKVQQRRQLMLNHYNERLSDLVVSMLNLDETKRPSFIEIINSPALRPYSGKISLSNSGHPLQSSRAAPHSNGINIR